MSLHKRPAVTWEHLPRERFERIVEALVDRHHDQDWDVRPINSRGGDDGIDIDATGPHGQRVIYQLKSSRTASEAATPAADGRSRSLRRGRQHIDP